MNATTPWITSSRSAGNSGNCVELRRHAGRVEVRDSKDRTGPVLRFAPAAFRALIAGAGEFDPASVR